MSRRLILTADDFGLDLAVNEAVEAGHRDGVLTAASLMVGAPAAADAVARARRLPGLAVGLHLVLVEGRPVAPPDSVRPLLGPDGAFDPNMARAGLRIFADPAARRALAIEIRAQFEAFAATGLALDHVNAHKHFHLHPTIAGAILRIGRDFGMRAIRVPAEPRAALGLGRGWADRALGLWTALLRRRVRGAGIAANDQVFGLAWSGGMTEARLLALLDRLPPGLSEIYLHPASRRTPPLVAAMPGYAHVEELAALLSPAVRDRLDALALPRGGFAAMAA